MKLATHEDGLVGQFGRKVLAIAMALPAVDPQQPSLGAND